MNTTANPSERKVAFITGASRGIGAETAAAFATAGYNLAITARSLTAKQHDYAGSRAELAGSLEETKRRCLEAADAAGNRIEVECLAADILDQQAVSDSANQALSRYGRVDVLINNACYQGAGNQNRFLDVTTEQMTNIWQGNVLTPALLTQLLLPNMLERGSGCVINMVSGSALQAPPAPVEKGGWSFAYPASKAALIRMAPTLRVEHKNSGVRFFGVEPGMVITEIMRHHGFDKEIEKHFKPTPPEHIAQILNWLADSDDATSQENYDVVFAPQLHKKLFQHVA